MAQQDWLAAVALPLARVLLAAPFLVAGVRKLLAWNATAGYFGKLGLPMPDVVLLVVVVLEIGGGILLVIGWRRTLVALALAAFTIATAFVGHAFWNVGEPQYSGQLNNFLKNVAIAGGLLYVAMTSTPARRIT
jgi:putative oxidoreductase